MNYILPFSQISKEDVPLVGGKGANLGEMTRAGFPVPPGFCITADTYREIIKHNQLEPKIRQILTGLDLRDNDALNRASHQVKKLIVTADIPTPISQAIITSYLKLQKGHKHPLVAVRSSATAEDLPDASFAGQQATFLNISGEANLIQAVREAWASLFEPRAIFYRQNKHYDHFQVAISLPVQLMVNSHTSGIMFTINPVTNDKRQIVIEAIYGLGEQIVQGAYTPDHYLVDKEAFSIYSKVVVPQPKMLTKVGQHNKEIPVPKKDQTAAKLSDKLIVELAKIGLKLQNHYMFPQDIEWAEENGQLYITQTRPITTIEAANKKKAVRYSSTNLPLILKGDPASPGIAFGRPRVLKSAKEINLLKPGEILVAAMTTPDFVPAMKKAAGIITNQGGQTSHAAIVSRELGVPAVVGTKLATSMLKKESLVTLNGSTGEIFRGLPKATHSNLKQEVIDTSELTTATKVYVNLGEPELAGSVATKNVDGVGLLRAEFMIAQIGHHPKKLIHDKKQEVFISKLADGLEKFCSAFGYRPIIYRATDFKTNEYRNLIGGQAYEPQESNPMLGYRGAYRYITDERVFELELEAIKRVRNKLGYKNLHLMIPFVRTVPELYKVKRIIAAAGLSRSNNFRLYLMVEIPSTVILLEEFAKVGIDGISIGSNDLTMLTLGVDRDNENVAPLYDERNPAVMWMFKTAIEKATKLGLTSSMCGQAPSLYPDLTEQLVKWGITAVSVSPDAIDRTRQFVHQAEQELIRKK